MLETKNKFINSKESLISERIKDNYQEGLQKLFIYDVVYDIEGIVIKLKLERAVHQNATEFRAIMSTLLNMNYKHYILDLSSALFMDSTFLGSIVVVLKKINSNGGKLSLILNYEKIKILTPFEQLKNILNIYNSPDEAITQIKNSGI